MLCSSEFYYSYWFPIRVISLSMMANSCLFGYAGLAQAAQEDSSSISEDLVSTVFKPTSDTSLANSPRLLIAADTNELFPGGAITRLQADTDGLNGLVNPSVTLAQVMPSPTATEVVTPVIWEVSQGNFETALPAPIIPYNDLLAPSGAPSPDLVSQLPSFPIAPANAVAANANQPFPQTTFSFGSNLPVGMPVQWAASETVPLPAGGVPTAPQAGGNWVMVWVPYTASVANAAPGSVVPPNFSQQAYYPGWAPIPSQGQTIPSPSSGIVYPTLSYAPATISPGTVPWGSSVPGNGYGNSQPVVGQPVAGQPVSPAMSWPPISPVPPQPYAAVVPQPYGAQAPVSPQPYAVVPQPYVTQPQPYAVISQPFPGAYPSPPVSQNYYVPATSINIGTGQALPVPIVPSNPNSVQVLPSPPPTAAPLPPAGISPGPPTTTPVTPTAPVIPAPSSTSPAGQTSTTATNLAVDNAREPLTDPRLNLQSLYVLQGDDSSARARVEGAAFLTPNLLVGGSLDVVTGPDLTNDDGLQLTELYVATSLPGAPGLRFRFGQLDLTSYFDRNSFAKDIGRDFFNSTFQTNPALFAGANVTASRPAGLVQWAVTDDIAVSAGIFSSDSDISDFALDGFAGEVSFRTGNLIVRGTFLSSEDTEFQGTGDRLEAYGLNAEWFIPSLNLGFFGRYGQVENTSTGFEDDTFSFGLNALDIFMDNDRLGLAYGENLEISAEDGDTPDVLELFYDFELLPNIRAGFTFQQRNSFTESFAGFRIRGDLDLSPRLSF